MGSKHSRIDLSQMVSDGFGSALPLIWKVLQQHIYPVQVPGIQQLRVKGQVLRGHIICKEGSLSCVPARSYRPQTASVPGGNLQRLSHHRRRACTLATLEQTRIDLVLCQWWTTWQDFCTPGEVVDRQATNHRS